LLYTTILVPPYLLCGLRVLCDKIREGALRRRLYAEEPPGIPEGYEEKLRTD
jgi:hypothetical protein